MNILVTGADGFVGRNLLAQLESEGDHRIFRFTRETSQEELQEALNVVDGIIHLAGVNRAKHSDEYFKGNVEFTKDLVDYLLRNKRSPTIVVSSSIPVERSTYYGKSKLDSEFVLKE